ncbi:hypothetical protein LCGC14_2900270, partial [marine sediment metagenome]
SWKIKSEIESQTHNARPSHAKPRGLLPGAANERNTTPLLGSSW